MSRSISLAFLTFVRAVVVAALLGVAAAPCALAQDRVLAPSDPSELIGAKVFAADGREVGEVMALSIGPGDEVTEIRMTTGSPLGIGPRTVVLPLHGITLLRGAVVVDLSSSEVDMLPNAPAGSLENPTKL
jgi:hypothetical protein